MTCFKLILHLIIDKFISKNRKRKLNKRCINSSLPKWDCSRVDFYKDTHEWFDKYYNDNDKLRIEMEHDTGEPLKIK